MKATEARWAVSTKTESNTVNRHGPSCRPLDDFNDFNPDPTDFIAPPEDPGHIIFVPPGSSWPGHGWTARVDWCAIALKDALKCAAHAAFLCNLAKDTEEEALETACQVQQARCATLAIEAAWTCAQQKAQEDEDD